MNEVATTPEASEAFPSLTAVQAEHLKLAGLADAVERLELAAASNKEQAPPEDLGARVDELRQQIGRFQRRAAATGSLLDHAPDRELAQSMIDYWCVRESYLDRLSERARALGAEGGEGLTSRPPPLPEPIELAPFDPESAPELADDKCPFIGLGAFGGAERSQFHGRSAAVGDLLGLIAERRLVIVTGPIGSGKSSLVMAGLVPALRAGAAEGSSDWVYWPPVVPGDDPFGALLGSVRPPDRDAGAWLAEAKPALQAAPKKLPELVAAAAGKAAPSLLVVDEAGELFDMAPESSWAGFLAALVALAQRPDPAHRVIVTIREDYLERMLGVEPMMAHPHLGWVYRIPPMTSTELRTAIEEPANAVGLKFDPGIVDDIIREVVNEPAALPLLQFTLRQLWSRRERNRISYASYEEIGRPAEALARAAERAFQSLGPDGGDQAAAREAFLALVTPTVGSDSLRRRMRRDELHRRGDAAAIDRALDRFAEAGLIRRTAGATAGEDRFEVMHDALARTWPRLVGWLGEARRERERLLMVLNQARMWDQSGRQPDHVAAGDALAEAAGFEQDDPLIRDYVAASRVRRAKVEKRRRWITSGFVALAVVAVATLILAWFAYDWGREFGFDEGEEKGNQIGYAAGTTLEREAPNASTQEWLKPGPRADVPAGRPQPGVEAVIWAGNGQTQILADPRTGQPVNANAVRAGSIYRLRTTIVLHRPESLRADGPAADQVGFAAQGRLVVAGRTPQAVRRRPLTDYWLRVNVIPHVVVNHTAPTAFTNQVVDRLGRLGYHAQLGNPEQVPNNLLIYFNKDDTSFAVELIRHLRSMLRLSAGSPVPVQCRLTENPEFGRAELDLHLNFEGLGLAQGATPTEAAEPECA